MKRAYIAPVTESVLVETAVPFAFSLNDEMGSGEQLSREFSGGDDFCSEAGNLGN